MVQLDWAMVGSEVSGLQDCAEGSILSGVSTVAATDKEPVHGAANEGVPTSVQERPLLWKNGLQEHVGRCLCKQARPLGIRERKGMLRPGVRWRPLPLGVPAAWLRLCCRCRCRCWGSRLLLLVRAAFPMDPRPPVSSFHGVQNTLEVWALMNGLGIQAPRL